MSKILSILIFSCLLSQARELDFSKYSSKLRRFIGDVTYRVDAGDRDKKLLKLPKHVKFHFDCNAAEQKIIEVKVAEFINVTGVTTEQPADKKTPVANIYFFFGNTEPLAKKASSISKKINLQAGSTYWKYWNHTTYEITKSYIFIDTQKLTNKAELEDRLIEQLCSVWGIPSKSDVTETSCMSEDEAVFVSLQPIDKAVLKFLYEKVPAGSRPSELNKIVRTSWGKKDKK